MSAPTETSVAAMKRLGRYRHKRLVWTYPFQRAEGIDVYSDTDWSGCLRTRKSTSGGCIMLGKHCIRTWSSTQPSVTLSSGEAEFYGLVKASGAGLGPHSLLKDLGLNLSVCVSGRIQALRWVLPPAPGWASSGILKRIHCVYREKSGLVRLW